MTAKEDFERGAYYHIYNHGNGADLIFKTADNYSFFLQRENKYMNEVWELVGWCLMPNHYHLLIKIREDVDGIESDEAINRKAYMQFSHFTNSYAKAFNKKYKRRGSLFVKTFKRKKVTTDDYLKRLVRYIHLNPVNHGFTSRPGDWPHSSYNPAVENFRLEKRTELNSIFEDEAEFLNFHSL